MYNDLSEREVASRLQVLTAKERLSSAQSEVDGVRGRLAQSTEAIREFEAPPPSDLGSLWEALADEPLDDRLRDQEIFATNSS